MVGHCRGNDEENMNRQRFSHHALISSPSASSASSKQRGNHSRSSSLEQPHPRRQPRPLTEVVLVAVSCWPTEDKPRLDLQVIVQTHRLPIQGGKFPVTTAEFAVLCALSLLADASASIQGAETLRRHFQGSRKIKPER